MGHTGNGRADHSNGRADHEDPASKLPPHNLEAERGVIGSVLQEWAAMDEVAAVLVPEDFYRDSHQILWRALLAAHDSGSPCDALILHDSLSPRDREAVGGPEGIAEVMEAPPHAANAKYYAAIVRERSVGRGLIGIHNEGLRRVYSNSFTAAQLVEETERAVFSLSAQGAADATVRFGTLAPGFLASLDRRIAGHVSGLGSGLTDLDDITCGFQPQDLIYVAGRTSMGKTALALNFVEHVAVNLGRPVLLVTLEMSEEQVFERVVISRAEVDGQRVRSGRISAPERERLAYVASELEGRPLFVDGSPRLTARAIASNARRYRAREGVEMLVVDLINHVAGDGVYDSRREEMTEISRRFKQIARELSIPVMVLAQVNRQPDARDGKRPRLSDLKECGSLEEDADMVLLLHRPDYYDPQDEPGKATVIVAKNRNGPIGDVRLTYRKSVMRFEGYRPDPVVIDAGPPY